MNLPKPRPKMKHLMLALYSATVLLLGSCSNGSEDEPQIAVPEKVSKALKTKYPSASQVVWRMSGTHYAANCRMDGREMEVWFNAAAVWKLTEVSITWEGLPALVWTGFNDGAYAGWTHTAAFWLQYPVNPPQYVLSVTNGGEAVQLFYSADGHLLQTRAVSGKEGSQWPINEIAD